MQDFPICLKMHSSYKQERYHCPWFTPVLRFMSVPKKHWLSHGYFSFVIVNPQRLKTILIPGHKHPALHQEDTHTCIKYKRISYTFSKEMPLLNIHMLFISYCFAD